MRLGRSSEIYELMVVDPYSRERSAALGGTVSLLSPIRRPILASLLGRGCIGLARMRHRQPKNLPPRPATNFEPEETLILGQRPAP